MSFIIPNPPNPDDYQYKTSPMAFNRAVNDWMLKTKGRLEKSGSVFDIGVTVQSPVAGDLTYYSSQYGWYRLPAGSPGQILTQGTATAPIWGSISSSIASGTGITITGSNTATINISLAAGANISISGTATQTIAVNGSNIGFLNGTNTWSAKQTFNSGMYLSAGAAEEAIYPNGNSGTAISLNLDNGNLQSITINGSATISQTTPNNPGKYTLIIAQDTTGHPYSFSGIKWSGGVPALSTSANAVDITSFLYNGTNFYGVANTGFA